MKTPLQIRFWQFLIKGVIAFTAVLVIAPQVSHKFYLCANLPVVSFKARHQPHMHASLADVAGSLLKHERRHRLSIDKRYTVKHQFALLPVHLVMPEPWLCFERLLTPRPLFGAAPGLTESRLRGPPVRLSQYPIL